MQLQHKEVFYEMCPTKKNENHTSQIRSNASEWNTVFTNSDFNNQIFLVQMYTDKLSEMFHNVEILWTTQQKHLLKSVYNRNPQPQTSSGLLGTKAYSWRWAAGEQSFICICSLSPTLASPHLRSSDSHRSANPTVNCICKGSRLCAVLPPKSMEKWSSTKLVPGAIKGGDLWLKT